MFVYSVKPKRGKTALAVLLALVAIVGLFMLFRGRGGEETVGAKPSASSTVKSNEDRIAFLKGFGWTVSEEACEIVDVAIPTEFNDVYNNYNAIQEKQGYDLATYRGKRVKRYTYEVTNYPNQPDNVRANLLVFNSQVIGGDICSLDMDGFMHGFRLERKTGD